MKKVATRLAKALKTRKTKKMEEPHVVKNYKILSNVDGREVRIYPPAKRTILYGGYNGVEHHFLQMPYLILGYVPVKDCGGAYLFGCFATEDLSEMSEKERQNATVYRMPFPAQLDRGMWGPCCLLSHDPWYIVDKDLDGLIERFWTTSFRALGDYGQRSVTCWAQMKLEEVFNMLKKSPSIYRGLFSKFLDAVKNGHSDTR